MVLDECPKLTTDKKVLSKAIEVSTHWAKRSKTEFGNDKSKALFGIVQGGVYEELREQSLSEIIEIDFDGIALGGLSVGETKEEKNKILSFLADKLPTYKPRYLMGVGKPEDIVEAVRYGIDMFDCVLPTRNARNGQLITSTGVVNIKNAAYIKSDDPIDENCDCKVSKNYSRAYLNHLFRTNEKLGGMLASYHNIFYYQSPGTTIKEAPELTWEQWLETQLTEETSN